MPRRPIATGIRPCAPIDQPPRIGDPRFSRFGIVNRKAVRDFAAEQIAAFDIKAAGPEAGTGTLSGGNLQKALLARERAFDPLVLCGGLVILAGAMGSRAGPGRRPPCCFRSAARNASGGATMAEFLRWASENKSLQTTKRY